MIATPEEIKAQSPALSGVSDAGIVGALTAVSEFVLGETGPIIASDFPATFKVRKENFREGGFLIGTKYAAAVSEMDGVAYTGVLGTDYWMDGNEVTMPGYWPTTQAPFFTVKVTGGLAAYPADLKRAVINLASFELSRVSGQGVTSQSLGPRSLTFAFDSDAPAAALEAARVIRSYTPPRP
jgi:hypothetical protein